MSLESAAMVLRGLADLSGSSEAFVLAPPSTTVARQSVAAQVVSA